MATKMENFDPSKGGRSASVLRRKEDEARRNQDAIDTYLRRSQAGEYISPDDMMQYKQAVQDYGIAYREATGKSTSGTMIDALSRAMTGTQSYMSNFIDQEDYDTSRASADAIQKRIEELRKSADYYRGSKLEPNKTKEIEDRIAKYQDYYRYRSDGQYAQKYDGYTLDAIDKVIASQSRRGGDESEIEWLKNNRYRFMDEAQLDDLIAKTEAANPANYEAEAQRRMQEKAQTPAPDGSGRTMAEYEGKSYYDYLSEVMAENGVEYREWTSDKVNAYKAQKQALAQNAEAAEAQARVDKANALRNLPQFEEYSKYVWMDDGPYSFYNAVNDGGGSEDPLGFMINAEGYLYNQNERGGRAMKPDEIAVYNYLYRTHGYGKEAAEQYRKDLDLTKRVAEEYETRVKDYAKRYPFLSSVFSSAIAPGKVVGVLDDIASVANGDGIDSNSWANRFSRAQKTIRETVPEAYNFGEAGRFFYNSSLSVLDNLVNLAAMGGNNAGVLVSMGMEAASDTVLEAKQRGMDDKSALAAGIVSGIFEALFEKVSLENIKALSEAPLKTTLGALLRSAGFEGSEEFLTSIANEVYDRYANGYNSEYETKVREYIASGYSSQEAHDRARKEFLGQLALDFAGGAFSGLLMGGGAQAIGTAGQIAGNVRANNAEYRATGNAAIEAGTVGDIVSAAQDSGEAKLQRLAQQVARANTEGMSQRQQNRYARDVGRLQYGTENAANRAASPMASSVQTNRSIVTEAMDEADVPEKLRPATLEAIQKAQDKGMDSLTKKQRALVDAVGGQEILDTLGSEESNIRRYNEFRERAEMAQQVRSRRTGELSGQKFNAEGKAIDVETGDTVTISEDSPISGFSTDEKGAVTGVMLKTEDGGKVAATSLSLPSISDAVLVNDIRSMAQRYDLTVSGANTIYKAVKSAGLDSSSVMPGIMRAYAYGHLGQQSMFNADLVRTGTALSKVSPELARDMYALGEKEADKVAQNAQKKVTGKAKAGNTVDTTSHFIVDDDVREMLKNSDLAKEIRSGISVAATVAKGTGIHVHVVNGGLVDENGRKVNAQFTYKNGVAYITIDANAAMDGHSIMAFTMSHELTHFIKDWSPTKFRTFAKFLMQNYAEEGHDAEIQQKILERLNSGMKLDLAMEETIAEACQRFLLDGNSLEKMTALAVEDRGLVKKIIAHVKAWVARVRQNLANANAQGKESGITQTLKNIDQIRAMWEEALEDATRNYRAAGQKVQGLIAGRAQSAIASSETAAVTPATREESASLEMTDTRNIARIKNEITATLKGTLSSSQLVMLGKPSAIIAKYLGSDKTLYMPQKSVRKAVLGKDQGGKHGLGRIVLDELAYQFADPMAITGNTSKHVQAGNDGIVVWTDWMTTAGDSIIVPIKIVKNGEVELYGNVNTVFDAYDQGYIKDLLREGNIRYTRDGKSIQELLTQRREVPESEIPNASSNGSIDENAESVKTVFGFSVKKSANVNEDLLEELSIHDPSAEVDEDGNVTVYHRTTAENAKKIYESGVMTAKEDALFFSSKDTGYASDYGDTVVELKVPSTVLEVNDIFDGEVHFDIPLKYANGSFRLDVSKYLVKEQTKNSRNQTAVTPEEDSRYLELANDPAKNEAELERMVAEAAKRAGYSIKGYHGTNSQFNTFNPKFIGDDNKLGIGFYFLKSKLQFDYARKIEAFLKINNPITDKSRDIKEETWKAFLEKVGIRNLNTDTESDLGIYIRSSYEFRGDKKFFLDEFSKITGKDGILSDDRNSILAFASNQIKSADPVTYDDNGNVIPLSSRFDSEQSDIRYQASAAEEEYSDYDKPITMHDVEMLRTIAKRGRISVNKFTHNDLVKAQKWAYKFYQELGNKSPFFRAWFGDWRAYDKNTKRSFVPVNTSRITPQDVSRTGADNADTGWHIDVSGKGIDETAFKRGKWSKEYHSLASINAMLENAILLDTVIVDEPSKNMGKSTAFVHHLYCPVSIDGVKAIAKLYVTEEVGNRNTFYLAKIETVLTDSMGLGKSFAPLSSFNTAEWSVAQIHDFVKQNNSRFESDSKKPTKFEPKPVNPALLNKDGTPKVFYHGTDAQFTVFDKAKAKSSGLYGKGFYFSESSSQAGVYGNQMAVYLSIQNPLVPGDSTITKEQIKRFLQAVSEDDAYSIENYGTYNVDEIAGKITNPDAFSVIQDINATAIGDFGEAISLFNKTNGTNYDGIITPTETVVYDPSQIKSATDNIGTFDRSNPDIRYQQAAESDETYSPRTLLSGALMSAAQSEADKAALENYQRSVKTLDAKQAALVDRRAKIRELSFAKGPRDTEQLARLRKEADDLEAFITKADQRLLKLESTAPLQRVLEVAKRKAAAQSKVRVEQMQEEADRRHGETAIRHLIADKRNQFIKMLEGKAGNKYVPKQLVNGLISVCEALDTTGPKRGTKAEQKYLTGRQALAQLKVAYDSLQNEDYDFSSEFSETYSQMISDLISSIGDTPVRDMSYDQLNDVYNIMSDIQYTLQTARKQIGTAEAITNYEAGQEIIELMAEVKRLGLTTNKVVGMMREWMDNPMRAVREMSGYDPNSRLVKLFNALNEGRIKMNNFLMMAYSPFEEMRSTKEGMAAFKEATEKAYDFGLTDITGKPLKISKMQAMQLVLTYEREQANAHRRHLETGALIPDVDLQRKGKYKEAIDKGQRTGPVSGQTVLRIMDNLSEWDKQYMDRAREFFNDVAKSAVNETTMILRHRAVAMELAYIPYVVDRDYVKTESENVKYDATIEGSGMLKTVVPGAKQQLVMGGLNQVITSHAEQVSKLYGLAIPVRNINKALNMQQTDDDGGLSVKAAIRGTWQNGGYELIDRAIADLQSPRRTDQLKLLSELKSAFVVSTLASNLSVWMKQAASYPTAGAIVSIRALTAGLAKYATKIGKGVHAEDVWAEIDAHTSEHWIRRRGLSMQELGEVNQSGGLVNRVNRFMGKFSPYNWIQAMDVGTTAALWYACKEQARIDGFKETDEGYWDHVTDLYQRVIEETQPMYDPLHRAEITKNTKLSNVIMFQTQPLQNSGILREGAMEFRANAKKYGVKSAEAKQAFGKFKNAVVSQAVSHFVFTGMTLLAALLTHRVNKWRDEETGDVTGQSVFEEFMKEFGKNYFNAILPVIGGYAISAFERFTGQNNYDVLTDATVNKVNDFVSKISRFTQKPSKESLFNLVLEIATFFSIPAVNARNIVEGFWLHVQDFAKGDPFSYESGYDRTGKQSVRSAYADFGRGDTEAAAAALKALADEKKQEYLDKAKQDGEYLTEEEAAKKAGDSVKSSVSSMIREALTAAAKRNDPAAGKKALAFMRETGFYKDPDAQAVKWVCSEYEAKYKKAVSDRDMAKAGKIRNEMYQSGVFASLSAVDAIVAEWRKEVK